LPYSYVTFPPDVPPSLLVLVDPGKLTFYLDPSHDPRERANVASVAHSQAVGVLAVKLTGRQPPGTAGKGKARGRVMTLRVGNKKYERPLEVTGAWQDNFVFLVNQLDQELVRSYQKLVKGFIYRLITSRNMRC